MSYDASVLRLLKLLVRKPIHEAVGLSAERRDLTLEDAAVIRLYVRCVIDSAVHAVDLMENFVQSGEERRGRGHGGIVPDIVGRVLRLRGFLSVRWVEEEQQCVICWTAIKKCSVSNAVDQP